MMTKGELNLNAPQFDGQAERPPSYPAVPQANNYQGPATLTPGAEYPMQQVQTPANVYPAPQQYNSGHPIPQAGIPPQMTSQIDPSTAAAVAVAGQQYRDQLFAQCAVGNHERTTSYGICGIITAVVCFPIGLICLFSDSEEKCARCGVSLGR